MKAATIKEKAAEVYNSLPLPESKYTSLRWWKEYIFPPEVSVDVEVDGPDGVSCEFLESMDTVGDIVPVNTNKFVAMHYAYVDKILRISFPKALSVDKPVYVKVNVKGRGHLHVFVEGEDNSKGEVVISVSGDGLYTEVVESRVDRNADIRIASVDGLSDSSVIFAARGVITEENSKSQLVGVWFGGKFVMSKHFVKPTGRGSYIEDVQVIMGHNRQHFDITTHLDFSAPYTKGESNIRAVLKDKARAVMYGLIDIEREAQFADAYLSEHAMLLNSGARADSIPGLEIMANQVRATHGATVGPIDPEKMFYLMSRGIEEKEAKKLIILGFFEPAIRRIGIEEARKVIIDGVEYIMWD